MTLQLTEYKGRGTGAVSLKVLVPGDSSQFVLAPATGKLSDANVA